MSDSKPGLGLEETIEAEKLTTVLARFEPPFAGLIGIDVTGKNRFDLIR